MRKIQEIGAADKSKPRKIAIHCWGGKGRTGWVLAVMKRALSPINGITWDELLEDVGRDYKKGAAKELADPSKYSEKEDRQEQLKSIPSAYWNKDQVNAGEIRMNYFRFMRG